MYSADFHSSALEEDDILLPEQFYKNLLLPTLQLKVLFSTSTKNAVNEMWNQ